MNNISDDGVHAIFKDDFFRADEVKNKLYCRLYYSVSVILYILIISGNYLYFPL